jgi:hypothetical protein
VILFVVHLLFTHLIVILYDQDCNTWAPDADKNEIHAKNQKEHFMNKHVRENSIVIYGINNGDNPDHVKEYLRDEINKLIEEKDMQAKIRARAGGLLKVNLETKRNEIRNLPASKDKTPLFSIHIPGDYNSVSILLDQYEDAKKQSDFSL